MFFYSFFKRPPLPIGCNYALFFQLPIASRRRDTCCSFFLATRRLKKNRLPCLDGVSRTFPNAAAESREPSDRSDFSRDFSSWERRWSRYGSGPYLRNVRTWNVATLEIRQERLGAGGEFPFTLFCLRTVRRPRGDRLRIPRSNRRTWSVEFRRCFESSQPVATGEDILHARALLPPLIISSGIWKLPRNLLIVVTFSRITSANGRNAFSAALIDGARSISHRLRDKSLWRQIRTSYFRERFLNRRWYILHQWYREILSWILECLGVERTPIV